MQIRLLCGLCLPRGINASLGQKPSICLLLIKSTRSLTSLAMISIKMFENVSGLASYIVLNTQFIDRQAGDNEKSGGSD